MPNAIRRCSVLTGVALCAVLGGGVGVARADDNALRHTLNRYAKTISNDEAAISRGIKEYRNQGKWKPLVQAYDDEVPVLRMMRRNLIHDQASTAKGATAKADLVTGLKLIAIAYATDSHLLQAARGGQVPRATALAAARKGAKGSKLFKTGFDLLK